MLKRSLILTVFLAAAWGVASEAAQLFLTFYVLFPMLLLPVIYFYDADEHKPALFCSLGAAGIYFFFLSVHPVPEMVLLGIGSVGFLAMLRFHRRLEVKRANESLRRMKENQTELEAMKVKYAVRVDNLDRLEKQVLSLMEIFEVARDFSGALKMEILCKLIFERMLPGLPFEKLRFILTGENQDEFSCERYFLIQENGVQELPQEFSDGERILYEPVFHQRIFSKTLLETKEGGEGLRPVPVRERWIFPLVIEAKTMGLVVVEGAHPDDLVKFEVFVSQLVLQVRKIRLYETVLQLSIIDGLTGVYVRRYFMERMAEELKRSIKYSLPVSVLMLDIDHFKRYNDQFGHLAGDETLKKVAALIRSNLRKVDIVARYGGEEFVVVLPESLASTAHEVAERIRSNIARYDFRIYDSQTKVTVSIGISTFPDDVFKEGPVSFYDDLAFDLIRHADKALYRAKEEGRNRIFQYRDLSAKGV